MPEPSGNGVNLLARLPPPRKIAVVRAPRLGDFICATPALRALRAAAPDAEIVLITLPMLRELASRLPSIDRIVPFPGFPGIAQQLFHPHAALAFFQRMQQERFDLAIQLQGSGVYANPFTLMLGARTTAGYVRAEDDASLLDAARVYPARGHETERLLALMRYLGAEPQGTELEFPLTPADARAAAALLVGLPRPLIGVHAGSHDPRRRWPLANFAEASRALLRAGAASVVVLGGAHEVFDALGLACAIGARARSLAGRTALGTLGAVIARLDLLLTNDTGPAHIGYALATPTVAVYRAGGTERYGPPPAGPFIGLEPEAPARDDSLVTVAQVRAAADRLLAAARYGPPEIAACASESAWTRSAR